MDEFRKYDSEKPRVDLLPSRALLAAAEVITYGATKYGEQNWRLVNKRSRYFAAALRHLFARMGGERTDPETGLPHVAHALTNLLFLCECELLGYGDDDVGPTV